MERPRRQPVLDWRPRRLAGLGIYNATKFAVEGLSEALAEDLSTLGIGVPVVEPGPFRTDFLGGSFATTAKRISDYDAKGWKDPCPRAGADRNQPGSPALAADAIVHAEPERQVYFDGQKFSALSQGNTLENSGKGNPETGLKSPRAEEEIQ